MVQSAPSDFVDCRPELFDAGWSGPILNSLSNSHSPTSWSSHWCSTVDSGICILFLSYCPSFRVSIQSFIHDFVNRSPLFYSTSLWSWYHDHPTYIEFVGYHSITWRPKRLHERHLLWRHVKSVSLSASVANTRRDSFCRFVRCDRLWSFRPQQVLIKGYNSKSFRYSGILTSSRPA